MGSLLFAVVLASLNAQAAELTRPVSIVKGAETVTVLGTGFGQTLYTFDLDQPGTSACYQGCAEKWPPLLVSPAEAAMLAEPYGTTTRTSGLFQVTYQGRPVYTFYLDRAEGEDKGNGLGGVWFEIPLTSER